MIIKTFFNWLYNFVNMFSFNGIFGVKIIQISFGGLHIIVNLINFNGIFKIMLTLWSRSDGWRIVNIQLFGSFMISSALVKNSISFPIRTNIFPFIIALVFRYARFREGPFTSDAFTSTVCAVEYKLKRHKSFNYGHKSYFIVSIGQ